MNKYKFLFFSALIGMVAMSCSRSFVPATYKTYTNGQVVFAGQKYTFNDDGTFKYESFTDNSNNGAFTTVGHGSYEIKDDRLVCTYAHYPAPVGVIDKKPIDCSDERNVQYTLMIITEKNKPAVGFDIALMSNDKVLERVIADQEGKAILITEKILGADKIVLSSMGFEEIELPIDVSCASYNIVAVYKRNYVKAETQEIYHLKTRKNKIVLRAENTAHWRPFYKEK